MPWGKTRKRVGTDCVLTLAYVRQFTCMISFNPHGLFYKLRTKAEKGKNLPRNSESRSLILFPKPLFFPLYHTRLKTVLNLSGITLLEPPKKKKRIMEEIAEI